VADFSVVNEGSVVLFVATSPAGLKWLDELDEHLEPWQRLGGSAFAVEHRFVLDVVEHIQSDGLELGD